MMYNILIILLYFSLSSCSTMKMMWKAQKGPSVRVQKRSNSFDGIKKKVAVLDFFDESPYLKNKLGEVATNELKKEMGEIGKFIIGTNTYKMFGDSKGVYVAGGMKLNQMARTAKINGYNLVIFGRVIEARIRERSDEIGVVRKTEVYCESKIEVRVFDVNSNKEIYSEIIRGLVDDTNFRFFILDSKAKSEYRNELLRYVVRVAVKKAIPNIMLITEKLDWVGRIARIVGNRIYINAGRKSRIHIGDVLKVITTGVDIFDPETGSLIGISKGEVKGTIEIVDYIGRDASVAILHSGGSVHEGDYVQLY